MIVEDDANWRNLLAEALQMAGNTVTTADDGVQAIKQLGLNVYDVAIFDLNLPRLNGVEAIRRLRHTDPDLPILGITANNDPTMTRAVIEAGANDVMLKPIGANEVIEIVARYARQKP